jgi:hypothetical protein
LHHQTVVHTFPASCPFVTVIGGTQGTTKVGARLSAGGFSNYFSQTGYQTSAVGQYLSMLGSQLSGGSGSIELGAPTPMFPLRQQASLLCGMEKRFSWYGTL